MKFDFFFVLLCEGGACGFEPFNDAYVQNRHRTAINVNSEHVCVLSMRCCRAHLFRSDGDGLVARYFTDKQRVRFFLVSFHFSVLFCRYRETCVSTRFAVCRHVQFHYLKLYLSVAAQPAPQAKKRTYLLCPEIDFFSSSFSSLSLSFSLSHSNSFIVYLTLEWEHTSVQTFVGILTMTRYW